MKKILGLILCTVVLLCCKKQEDGSIPNTLKISKHSGQINSSENAVVMDADSNLFICGNQGPNIFILKTTKEGQTLWRKEFSAGGTSKAYGIVETDDHSLFICGTTTRNSGNGYDMLVIKTTATGDTLWTKTFGGTGSDIIYNIVETSDGNILLAAASNSYGFSSFNDIYLIKLTPAGTVMWKANYPESGNEVPYKLIESAIGGTIIVIGTHSYTSNGGLVYMLRTQNNGVPLFDYIMDEPNGGVNIPHSAIEIENGNRLIIVGEENVIIDGQIGTQAFLFNVDYSGSINWRKAYGNDSTSTALFSVKSNKDGSGYSTTGSTQFQPATNDAVLITANTEGNPKMFRPLALPTGSVGFAIYKDPLDNHIIIGNSGTDSIFIAHAPEKGWYSQ